MAPPLSDTFPLAIVKFEMFTITTPRSNTRNECSPLIVTLLPLMVKSSVTVGNALVSGILHGIRLH